LEGAKFYPTFLGGTINERQLGGWIFKVATLRQRWNCQQYPSPVGFDYQPYTSLDQRSSLFICLVYFQDTFPRYDDRYCNIFGVCYRIRYVSLRDAATHQNRRRRRQQPSAECSSSDSAARIGDSNEFCYYSSSCFCSRSSSYPALSCPG